MKFLILVCAVILGSFAVGDAISSRKCEACKSFIELSGYVDESLCANACVELSEETVDSSELTLIQLGCNGCLSLANRITGGIHKFSFRNIISGVNRGCSAAIPNCKAFIAKNEDEFIDAIYHYKKDAQKICHAVHQC